MLSAVNCKVFCNVLSVFEAKAKGVPASTALRFTMEMEIVLYKETININPYQYDGPESVDAWTEVGQNLREALALRSVITPRTARQKVDRELAYYKSENRKNIQK